MVEKPSYYMKESAEISSENAERNYLDNAADEELRYELLSAFGPGKKIINVITGEVIQL